MSQTDTDNVREPSADYLPVADSLADSVMLLLAMTVVQRLVGLCRSVLFCRWLDLEQLGQWDVAFSFLNLAAPLAVLGLPGSFPRYIEHYRQRGQLRTFLRRSAVLSTCTVLLVIAALLVGREWFSRLIFGRPDQGPLVVWLAICLATLVFHNSIGSLLIGLRRFRVVTVMQFLQSVAFAGVSGALVLGVSASTASVVGGFSLACLASTVACLAWLRRSWRPLETSAAAPSQRAFWAKLLPFALWLWATNFLAGLFEVADRYMIVHFSGMPAAEALRQVGNYHSSRIIPFLFMTIAGMIGSLITPHLSCDWEAGRRQEVVARLNLALKTLLLAMFAGSIAVLASAPWLFEVAFAGKFAGGLAVLPWTLTYFTWFGVFAMAQNYLWCAENARLGSLALLAGLLVNVSLNVVLLPRLGLFGAAWSTTAANFVALSLVYSFSALRGMRIDFGTIVLSLAPATLLLGPATASILLAALLMATYSTEHVFRRDEKERLSVVLLAYARRVTAIARRSGAECRMTNV